MNPELSEVHLKRQHPVRLLVKAVRVHQWVKNLLIAVPLLLAHELGDPARVVHTLLAFVAFSLCASSVYVINDLLDREADRRHPRKRHRPFASGALPVRVGLLIVPALLAASFALALLTLPPLFAATLAVYVVLTTLYSLVLKQLGIVDVLVLAGLYTLRIVAGALAAEVPLSQWLLAFSMFLFLSLAILKRYAELSLLQHEEEGRSLRRDYAVTDMELLRSLGPAAGLLSVLVMALYISSDAVVELYRRPEVLWLALPPLLYWIMRMWFVAQRGQMHDDPLVFTVKDRASYLVGTVIAILTAAAI